MTRWLDESAHTRPLHTFSLIVGVGVLGCSSSQEPTPPAGGGGGQSAVGSTTASVDGSSVEGATSIGGSAATSGSGVGGSTSSSTDGTVATDGAQTAVGGTTATSSTATDGVATTTGVTTTGDQSSTSDSTTTGGGGSAGATTTGATTGGSTTGGTVDACSLAGTPLTGGTDYCSNGLGDLGNGYSYEIWMDSGSNCGTMYGVDANFRAEWNLGNGGDFQARAGLFFGSTQTFDEIGTISADYAFTKMGDGFSWVAVYGWTFEPLTEYYIVEDFTKFRPATDYIHEGTITVDGGTYDIYRNRRMNAASPAGTTDFDQFWSVRQEGRQCGHVSVSEHLSTWAGLGMEMGLMRESMLLVEALDGTGTVDFTYATVQVD